MTTSIWSNARRSYVLSVLRFFLHELRKNAMLNDDGQQGYYSIL